MSISIEEARKKLDTLEKLSNDPSLILTDLFSEGVSGSNFLYQVNIKGKYIIDYLIEHLQKLSVFEGCIIKQSSWDLKIYMESLKYGGYGRFESDDLIVKVDIESKTFKSIDECYAKYEDVMHTEYKLQEEKLSNYWIRFVNPTFKNRIRYAIEVFSSHKKPLVKLLDFWFWIAYPLFFKTRNRITEALKEENIRLNDRNKDNLDDYSERLNKQKFYKENASAHISKIVKKAAEIEEYLRGLGYKEDREMSDY
ncbi:hypothetical protein [Lacrimispora amygdalina]|uniref:hypothetical protein n=1 Tax=Lacrimispora amygdalina TaxID=253257 RepID=UPI000BE344B5|nr:hypothetical protein [Lacrimispora amygdalina]